MRGTITWYNKLGVNIVVWQVPEHIKDIVALLTYRIYIARAPSSISFNDI